MKSPIIHILIPKTPRVETPMKTSKLTHAQLTERYGISRNRLQYHMLNHFVIPTDVRNLNPNPLAVYDFVRTSGASLRSLIYDGAITTPYAEYAVVYKGCTPAQVYAAPEVKLSFRAAHEDFVLTPICVISLG